MKLRFDFPNEDAKQLRRAARILYQHGVIERDSEHAVAQFMLEAVMKGFKTSWEDICVMHVRHMIGREKDRKKAVSDLIKKVTAEWKHKVKLETLKSIKDAS